MISHYSVNSFSKSWNRGQNARNYVTCHLLYNQYGPKVRQKMAYSEISYVEVQVELIVKGYWTQAINDGVEHLVCKLSKRKQVCNFFWQTLPKSTIASPAYTVKSVLFINCLFLNNERITLGYLVRGQLPRYSYQIRSFMAFQGRWLIELLHSKLVDSFINCRQHRYRWSWSLYPLCSIWTVVVTWLLRLGVYVTTYWIIM